MIPSKLVNLAAVILPALFVAACGGGGGGSSAPAASVAAAPAPASPKALMVYVPSSGVAGTTIVSTSIMPTAASTLSMTGTTTRTATVTGGLANGQASSTTGALALTCSGSGLVCSDSNPGVETIIASTGAGAGSLAYASYGLLVTPNGTGANMGGYHNGTPTAVSSMPTNVTATYTGTYAGFVATPNVINGQVGDANLTANFSGGTVAGSVTNLTNVSTLASAGYGLSMNGTISGGAYTGTAGFTNTAGGAAATVTSSALTGGFYGPGAVETAGALTVRGTAPTTGTATLVTGAFGAKKN
jgi:C-lobe and N-lobe beta barrels of Tf-binding protein B